MERLKFEECKNCKDWNGCMVNCINICGKPLDALEKFNEYMGLEEQGKLLKLPCKVCDTVYSLECGRVEPDVVVYFQNDGENLWFINRLGGHIGIYGKTVFLTKEEAEAALREMNERED